MLFFVSVTPVILPLRFGQEIMNEGGFAQVSCIVSEGDEPLSINWSFHGHALSDSLGIMSTRLATRGRYLMIPALLWLLVPGAMAPVIAKHAFFNLLLSELLTNVHAFATIVTNHGA